jgi:hypothetical protein
MRTPDTGIVMAPARGAGHRAQETDPMFDLSTFGPAVISIGGFAGIIAFIKVLAGGDDKPLDESLPTGTQEEEPVRFRFPQLATPAAAGAAA